MGRVFTVELQGRHYKCRHCSTPLALADDVMSRDFHCRRGRAYLFTTVVNVTFGLEGERAMSSGLYIAVDICCCCCGQILGWKYVVAHEGIQRYKEGKFVLERYQYCWSLTCIWYEE